MSIVINLDKAKEITHAKRREVRAEEFRPYDAVVALQIPNNDHTLAEAERVKIRDKYSIIQSDIDACTNIEDLKSILNKLGE